MIKVLSISTDRKIFEEGSAVRARMVEYAGLFEELHIVVLTTWRTEHKVQIANNCWVYSTNSWSRWFYIFSATRIGKSIIKNEKSKTKNWVIDSQDPFECGLIARKISKKFHLPLRLQIHTDFLNPCFSAESFLNRVRVFIAIRILKYADSVRVVSKRIADSLPQIKLDLSRVTILPIFVDVEKIRETQIKFDLQKKYARFGFIMLTVARLTNEKNVSFALCVLKEVVKKYPTTGLVIVGDGPLRSSLESQVRDLGLENNVVFEGWQSDLVSYYKTANLFLQTSLYEGFGLALFEALACGLPAVSTDVGIAPELLIHKGHNFVCPVGDLNCFATKIFELITDNQLREFFALQIASEAVRQFSITKNQYLEKYKNSLELAQNSFVSK